MRLSCVASCHMFSPSTLSTIASISCSAQESELSGSSANSKSAISVFHWKSFNLCDAGDRYDHIRLTHTITCMSMAQTLVTTAPSNWTQSLLKICISTNLTSVRFQVHLPCGTLSITVCMKVLVYLTVFLIREVGEKSGMVRVEDKILSFIWSGELW